MKRGKRKPQGKAQSEATSAEAAVAPAAPSTHDDESEAAPGETGPGATVDPGLSPQHEGGGEVVVTITASALTPDDRNANRGTKRGLDLLATSLGKYGAGRSILVDRNGRVIAGNKTLDQLVDMGIPLKLVKTDGKTAVVVQRTDLDLDSPEGRGLAIADNRVGEIDLSWDPDVLAQLKALEGSPIPAFFFDEEIEEIFASDRKRNVPDEVPTPEETIVTRLGDIWVMGACRVICGDSTSHDTLSRLLGTEKARLIVTSPPYNHNIGAFTSSGMHAEGNWATNVKKTAYVDNKPEEQYQSEQVAALNAWRPFLTPDGSIFYNHKNRYRDKEVVSPWKWISAAGVKVRQEIIWRRPGSVTQNARMFLPCDERIFWLYFGKDFCFLDTTEHKSWSSVWDIAPHMDVGGSAHSCAFPLELVLRPVKACTKTGDIVLDPYGGSGTTVIAAEQCGRRGFTVELEPRFVDVIVRRWQKASGKSAVLAGTSRTFAAVGIERSAESA